MIRHQPVAKQFLARQLRPANLQLLRLAHHIPQSHFHFEPYEQPREKQGVRFFSSPSHFRLFWATASISALGAYAGPVILCVAGPPLFLGSLFVPKHWFTRLGQIGKRRTVSSGLSSEFSAAASPEVGTESTTHRAHEALYSVVGHDLKGLGSALRVDPHSLKLTEVESMSYGEAHGEVLDFGLVSHDKRIANVTVSLNGHKTRLEVQPLGSEALFIATSNKP